MLHSFFHLHVGDRFCGTRIMASVRDLEKFWASRGISYAIHCLDYYPKCSKQLEMMRSDTLWSSNTHTILIIDWGHALTIEHSVISVMTGFIVEMLFMLSFVYVAV